MDLGKIPILGWIFNFFGGEGVDIGVPIFFAGVLFIIFGFNYFDIPQSRVVSLLFATAPVWLPVMTFLIFFMKYMEMVGKKFGINSGRTIMEIMLPPEVFKSPEAMEFVFTQIYNAASPDNLMETYLDGKRPLPYTFELVSKGGDVHFYITTPNKFVSSLTDSLYSQYPGVEIRKLDVDYAAEIPMDMKGISFMSFHVGKKKDSAFPIKTYIDFGMDKLPKEEEKIDPMTPMLEVLAGIQPHQQLWVQFVIVAERDQNFKNGQLRKKGTWEKGAQEEIDKIMNPPNAGPTDFDGMPRLTPGQRDTIEAIERNMGKSAFKFASRVVYISHKNERDYDGGLFARISRMVAATEIKDRNGIGIRWRTDYNYKFLSDPFYKKIPALKKAELKEYRLRKFYTKAQSMKYKIMTTEEMATIFHLPGAVAQTPTLNRVGSTRSEAPANLPTGNFSE